MSRCYVNQIDSCLYNNDGTVCLGCLADARDYEREAFGRQIIRHIEESKDLTVKDLQVYVEWERHHR